MIGQFLSMMLFFVGLFLMCAEGAIALNVIGLVLFIIGLANAKEYR
jgi:hypothetical protein